MQKFKRLKFNLLYSPKTHYLLNNFTLSIKDKEIESEFFKARVENFNEHLPRCLVFALVYFAFRLLQVIIFSTKITRAFYAFHIVLYVALWFAVTKTCKRFTL